MVAPRYIVDLTETERVQLLQLLRKGRSATRALTRARILLKADDGLPDTRVAEAVHAGIATVARVRKRFVEEGLSAALTERRRPGQRRKFTGKQEAHLIAVACSAAPQGHARWTLRLLADTAVELGFAESVARETVRQVLKKQTSSPGRRRNGASRR